MTHTTFWWNISKCIILYNWYEHENMNISNLFKKKYIFNNTFIIWHNKMYFYNVEEEDKENKSSVIFYYLDARELP